MKHEPSSPRSAILRGICIGAVAMWAQTWELARAGIGEPASVSDTVAMQKEVDAFENAFTNTLRKLDQQGGSKSSSTSEMAWGLMGIGLIGAVVMIKYVPRFLEFRDTGYQARLAAAKAAVQVHPEMAAEEKAFEIFAENFNTGPVQKKTEPGFESGKIEIHRESEKETKAETPRRETERQSAEPKPELAPGAENGAIKRECHGDPSEYLPALRKLVSELSKAAKEPEKLEAVTRLSAEVEAFKSGTEASEWLPAWKVGTALE